MAITISDVAKKAGVSKSTVSQFLNGRYEFMSEDTKEKVQAAIAEMNYKPNQLARSLKQKKTNVIAIVAATLSSRFTTEIVSNVEKYFNDKQVDVIVASTEDDSTKEKNYIESLQARQVDGLIVFPNVANRGFYNDLIRSGFPIVFIDRYIENVDTQTVVLDNYRAGKLATEKLIENGHHKIGIVSFPLGENDGISNRRDRVNGYLSAMQEHGLPISNELILQTSAKMAVSKLSDYYRKTQVTGLILSNDILLEQTLIWVKEQKINLPEELSIVSIDDVSFARFFTPSITTVSQPVEDMAKKVAELLEKKIAGKEMPKTAVHTFNPKIRLRESIKKI